MNGVKQNRVLILGYGPEVTRIHKLLLDKTCEVIYDSSEPDFEPRYDLVVSFGYRNIISSETMSRAKCSFINLHMSFLPYNRGAPSNSSTIDLATKQNKENQSLMAFSKTFAGVIDFDDEDQVFKALLDNHPLYNGSLIGKLK